VRRDVGKSRETILLQQGGTPIHNEGVRKSSARRHALWHAQTSVPAGGRLCGRNRATDVRLEAATVPTGPHPTVYRQRFCRILGPVGPSLLVCVFFPAIHVTFQRRGSKPGNSSVLYAVTLWLSRLPFCVCVFPQSSCLHPTYFSCEFLDTVPFHLPGQCCGWSQLNAEQSIIAARCPCLSCTNHKGVCVLAQACPLGLGQIKNQSDAVGIWFFPVPPCAAGVKRRNAISKRALRDVLARKEPQPSFLGATSSYSFRIQTFELTQAACCPIAASATTARGPDAKNEWFLS
jgi:hypothetical protein